MHSDSIGRLKRGRYSPMISASSGYEYAAEWDSKMYNTISSLNGTSIVPALCDSHHFFWNLQLPVHWGIRQRLLGFPATGLLQLRMEHQAR